MALRPRQIELPSERPDPMRIILIRMARLSRTAFFRDASSVTDSVTLQVLPGVLYFGLIATAISIIERVTPDSFTVGIPVTPYEVGGAALGLLLVLRTNEGIGRWWEGRKLWGSIVNHCRDLAVSAIAYGPADPAWRRSFVLWTAAYAHACRRSLRGQRDLPEIAALVGEEAAARVAEAEHMPGYVALVLARMLRDAVDRGGMDNFAFLRLDTDRAALIDHIGGCERILKTPLPRAYSIQIRRFVFVFLLLLPFGFISKVGAYLSPIVTMLLAYPLLSLDKIGSELQNPFSDRRINHIDLDAITSTIEANLLGLLDGPRAMVEVVAVVDMPDDAGPA